jgi:hypothetical protein
MIIIHKGKKIVEGNVADLLDPAHTLVTIEARNNEDVKRKLVQSAWAPFIHPGESPALMMDKEAVPQLISDLVAMNIQLLSVNSSHSLENYFLSLTTQPGHAESFAN